jgi:hypothetical protein
MRADTYSFWKAVRPVSYSACFATGLTDGRDSLLLPVLLPDEQPSNKQSSAQQKMTIFFMKKHLALSIWHLALQPMQLCGLGVANRKLPIC